MGIVAPGMQETDGDRVDALPAQRLDRPLQGFRIERRLHGAIGAQPLGHAEPPAARHQRLRRRQAQIVAVRLQALAHFQHIAVALGRQQADRGALALQDGVGRDRGAVHDALGPAEQGRKVEAHRPGQPFQPVQHPGGLVRGRRGRLGDPGLALAVHGDEVGKGAAYVDADPVFGPSVAHVSVPFPAPPGASSACIPCRNRISGCGTAS